MPKHDFLTPKAIANRIKAKGLQKLKFYCEMCKKQCRDENGFKCHTMSESHQRQLLIFSDNPGKFMYTFNKEFMDGYLDLLKRQYGGRRVHANQVYQDYIKDRDHVHMNSTRWHTLTGFVNWLGKKGICKVDETEEGWFVQYIDRDPEKLRREKTKAKLDEIDKREAEEARERHQQLLEAARAREQNPRPQPTELQREDDEADRVAFSLGAKSSKNEAAATNGATAEAPGAKPSLNPLAEAEAVAKLKNRPRSQPALKRKSALDEIIEENERKKRRQQPPPPPPKEEKRKVDYWLTPGIVVKLTYKKLPDHLYRRKAVVEKMEDRYTALVRVLPQNSTDEKEEAIRMKVDQEHVETVIPAIDRRVRIVSGPHRGQKGILRKVNEKSFTCKVELNQTDSRDPEMFVEVPYEDLSKVHDSL